MSFLNPKKVCELLNVKKMANGNICLWVEMVCIDRKIFVHSKLIDFQNEIQFKICQTVTGPTDDLSYSTDHRIEGRKILLHIIHGIIVNIWCCNIKLVSSEIDINMDL